MEAFHEVASGVEDAHRTLVQRLEELTRERADRPDRTESVLVSAGLETIPPCDGVITLEVIERQAVLATLDRFGGHRQRTAQALGIGVRTLGMKLRAWKDAGLVAPSA